MRLELEKRAEQSRLMVVVSPLIAIGLTLIAGAILFAALGHDPVRALTVYFIEPVTAAWSLQELFVKATPLVIIAVGLSVCYLSNTWNIGAEGQFTVGAIAGSWVALSLNSWDSPLLLPLILIAGTLGGMAWGAIPALLKTRFNANEILTSLMLVYVAQFLLDYLVRGPWRDPAGYNFPESELFSAAATMPLLIEGGRLHIGAIFALVVVVAGAVLLAGTLKGFEIRVIGQAPRAGQFAGFSRTQMVVFAFLLSGGLAGLAGISEVAGPIGQLRPTISPGYGFAAIIVAFLGRLNPIAILFAGLLLALSYLGGEAAQVSLGISDKTTKVFQGMLLLFVLSCDTLILYKIRLLPPRRRAETVDQGAGE